MVKHVRKINRKLPENNFKNIQLISLMLKAPVRVQAVMAEGIRRSLTDFQKALTDTLRFVHCNGALKSDWCTRRYASRALSRLLESVAPNVHAG